MINLHERMLPTSAGVEPATSWSPVGRASNCATEGGYSISINEETDSISLKLPSRSSFCQCLYINTTVCLNEYLERNKCCLNKQVFITKTCLYNFDPLKPHQYIVILGFTGVYIIFLISAQNIDCGYSLEPPRRGGSNEYPQSMFSVKVGKISEFFI